MRHSKYFGAGDDESRPPASSDRRGVLLPALRSRKRKQREAEENATASSGRGSQQLTAMEKQVVTLRRAHPDTLLLFECGYRMRIFAEDAENAAAVLGIRAQRHKQFVEASVPVHRTLFHARRLVHAGFKVGVVRQTDSVAMRAASKTPGAQRKPLERCVAEIYTRATIPDVDEGGNDSDDSNEEEDTRTRFIACIVEATVHSKPFFSQSMHEVDEETKRSQAFSEEVQIGVFVHDVHTGETKFDEFEDDGKRQRLQRTLESLDPVEFVLPVGRLSAYTEQLLESFVTAQSDSSAVMNDTYGEEILQSCIRVERIPNEFFEFSLAKETFASVFPSLDMVRTLIAPNYLSLASPTAAFTGQFCLPAEAHRDLDLFVNSTTKCGVGSLSLVLIDEIGFGMAAHLAEAVGVAQMLYFVETVGCQVVFATHLTTSIQKLQDRLGDKCQTKQLEYHFYDHSGDEAKDVVTFHYVLKDGIASDSFAIETARRAGIAPSILERAQVLRGSL
ncbi:DNA mismatch repair protein Msh3 [Phytophthora cinnamomi]|uniref:DNA mismatch repair protein Msh3 n=1 Tax=Phytophthora cinnamomi TaxID=4785 RepID=UPI0035595DEF|nr:DNA mismatch repair protein Msh3 [Phytophthora cinnamomi]